MPFQPTHYRQRDNGGIKPDLPPDQIWTAIWLADRFPVIGQYKYMCDLHPTQNGDYDMASYAYIGTNADQSWQLDTVVSIYEKSMGEVELIIEISGWQKLDELMQCMSAGDVLQISDLSQLGGTAIRVMDRLTELIGMGVTVLSVEEGGAIDPNLLLYMRTLAAEILTDNCPSGEPLGERRRRKGRPTGSRLDIHATEIQQLLGEGISNSSIARRFNVSRQSFKDFAISRGLIM